MRLAVEDELTPAATEPFPAPGDLTPATLRVFSHGQTDRGRVRPRNEDQFLVAELTRTLRSRQCSLPQPDVRSGGPCGHLFVVADGVGGNAAGQEASALAVDAVEGFALDALHWFARPRGGEGDQVLADFRQALLRADERLVCEARRHPEFRGMGTTLTLAYALGRELFVAHVGDSRCYLLRGGHLFRVTRDHTLVEELVRHGLLTPEQAARHAYRHVVTNVLGGDDAGAEVEVHKLALEAGDVLLLCSDGLTEMVGDKEIGAVLLGSPDPAAACDRLVSAANEHGGRDNITAVVARFEAGDGAG